MSRPIRFHHGLLLLIIALGAFLLLMPTNVQPVAWSPEAAPSLSSGPYADNQRLKGVVRVGAADIDGPEALLLENNALITGLHDGRVIRTSLDGQDTKVLTDTGGRPLGLARHPNGLLLLDKLEFANGVTLGPDDAFVLVNETGAYRITRYWLSGSKAGTHDLFIDNLPGLPDNLAFNGRDRFWVALYTPRNALLDKTAPHPFVRKMIARAMTVLPKPVEKRAFVLGLDLDGKVIANLQDGSSGNYSPITTAREYGDWLYFGSLRAKNLVRLPLSTALQ